MAWAIFDLDGTLCDTGHREHLVTGKGKRDYEAFHALCHLDPPRVAERALAQAWVQSGNLLAILSGRTEAHREATERWLVRHGIPYHALGLRPNGDHRPSEVVKEEWYRGFQASLGVSALFVVEDRDKMVAFWRRIGVTCLQCQPGAY